MDEEDEEDKEDEEDEEEVVGEGGLGINSFTGRGSAWRKDEGG